MLNQLWTALEEGAAPKGLRCLNTHRIVIHPDYTERLKTLGLDSIPGVLHSSREETTCTDANQEKNVVKRIEITYEGQTQAFYLKLFRNSDFKVIWTRAFRGSFFGRSMLRTEYENLEKLAKCGLRTPELVAYGDHRFAGGVINSFIITKEIPQAMGVDYLAHEWLGQQTDEDRKRKTDELVHEAARVVKKMHGHGFEHHDLFLRNMMISELDMSKLYVMDTPRGFFWPRFIMRKRRAFDLATLDSAATQSFTRSQRMRFMLQYLSHDRLTKEDKQFVRKVLALCEPMSKRQLRRLERSISVDENGKPETS